MPPSDEHAEQLVGQLVTAGVTLTAHGNDLEYDGPAHAIGEQTLTALRANKEPLLALLADNRARAVIALGPTTQEQQRMELRSRIDRNPATYNVCIRVDLDGPVQPTHLDRAVTALTRRHETLRTRFAWYGDYLLQEVMAPPRTTVQLLPPELLAGATDDEVLAWCTRRGAAPFDLAVDPPARWCYVPIGQQQAILLVTMHHIACDGWSIGILTNELALLYRAETVENLPPVELTPRDFARWEQEWLTDERVESARAFWTGELADVELTPKLKRGTGKPATGGAAAAVVRVIPPAAATQVSALAHTLGTTEFSVYFAAFALLLHAETNGQDCAVVIAVANRTQREHESVVGLCRNAVPIRCSVHDGDTIDVVAQRLSAHVVRAIDHQTYPISTIHQEIDMTRLPITFGFEPQDTPPIRCSDLSVTQSDVFLGAARAEFSLLIKQRAGELEAFFEYAEDQLTPEDAAQLADRYLQILLR